MKKLHIAFGILAGIITVIALATAIVLSVNTIKDSYTSFPVWAPFAIVGMYYAIALLILGIVWLILWLILRHKVCKTRERVL